MAADDQSPAFERLLEHLRETRGIDFTGYKRSTLMRRTGKRMRQLGAASFEAYLDYLTARPDELEHLLDIVLINVTEFFRDPAAWQALAEAFLPALLAEKGEDEPIRVWSAGCATGEEAYSLAILLAEALGIARFRERVELFATDLDEDALWRARQATYPAEELVHVPEALKERYFTLSAGRYAFRSDLRRRVTFGRHNLVEDAPISRLDLLTCRNTLMYFTGEMQGRVMERFHLALRPGGLLMLGRAETMRAHVRLFRPLDPKARIFGPLPRP